MQQSAGYAIIDNDRGAVLCVRAYANWDFPKGHLEEGETHRDAAVREVFEEVSLKAGIDYVDIGTSPVAVTYGKGARRKTATYFLADSISETEPFCPVSPELGKPENDEWRWIPYEDLYAMLPPRLEPVVDKLLGWVGYR
jgi:8-oxo-dGTP pyrophosphatase MutT (NUDIX family)